MKPSIIGAKLWHFGLQAAGALQAKYLLIFCACTP
jgi:hypothetical protein